MGWAGGSGGLLSIYGLSAAHTPSLTPVTPAWQYADSCSRLLSSDHHAELSQEGAEGHCRGKGSPPSLGQRGGCVCVRTSGSPELSPSATLHPQPRITTPQPSIYRNQGLRPWTLHPQSPGLPLHTLPSGADRLAAACMQRVASCSLGGSRLVLAQPNQ